jgi:hypothetical protein
MAGKIGVRPNGSDKKSACAGDPAAWGNSGSGTDANGRRLSRDQILTLIILACLVALFLGHLVRYDIVALLALLAAVACVVPADKAFNRFSNRVLTPIGHQSNTPVMGLGGYRFGDYWKLGLPLSVLVVALGVPLMMIFCPLH